jgi:tRNA pseudouridine38-40 synthase
MRCARTDKGVHAAGQIVSVKMTITDPSIIQKINDSLPPQIRVWGFARTNKNFHAKNRCDARLYEYVFPTYILGSTPLDTLAQRYPFSGIGVESGISIIPESLKSNRVIESIGRVFGQELDIPKSTPEELEKHREYRISPQVLKQLKDCLGMYQGTHNYFNFTNGKNYNDKSAKRHIISFTVSDFLKYHGVDLLF